MGAWDAFAVGGIGAVFLELLDSRYFVRVWRTAAMLPFLVGAALRISIAAIATTALQPDDRTAAFLYGVAATILLERIGRLIPDSGSGERTVQRTPVPEPGVTRSRDGDWHQTAWGSFVINLVAGVALLLLTALVNKLRGSR